jgi:hypothetical protein
MTKRIETSDMFDAFGAVHAAVGSSKHCHNTGYLQSLVEKFQTQISVNQLKEKLKEFDQKVWFKGLQKHVLSTRERGVSAKVEGLEVLTYTMAGRTMITFREGENYVSAVADETSTECRTGLQGIGATAEQAWALIDSTIHLFETGLLVFKDDDKVSII